MPMSANPPLPSAASTSSTYPRSTSDDSFGHTPDFYFTPSASGSSSTAPTSLGTAPVSPDPSAMYHAESSGSGTAGSWAMGGRSASIREGSSFMVDGGGSRDRDRHGERKSTGSAAPQQGIRRPEDLFRVVKERLLAWSYLVQWYQGYVPFFTAQLFGPLTDQRHPLAQHRQSLPLRSHRLPWPRSARRTRPLLLRPRRLPRRAVGHHLRVRIPARPRAAAG